MPLKRARLCVQLVNVKCSMNSPALYGFEKHTIRFSLSALTIPVKDSFPPISMSHCKVRNSPFYSKRL